ncbi:hypothetical protein M0802_002701 [Mischocyttarus mexicanus]|nr:hypothetical protein M0802_002701 [Mischocyttarus mexicanus]
MPELKKKIPSIWKSSWKKELQSNGITQCRQIGCDFSSNSYDDMCKHCSQCNFTPQKKFICKLCKFESEDKEEIIEHIKAKHSEIEYSTDNSPDFKQGETTDDESEDDLGLKLEHQYHTTSSEKERSDSFMMFLDDSRALKASWSKFYLPAFKWTLEFEMENYEFQFYNDYLPNPFILLNNEDAKQYLPPLKVSMATKTVTVNSSTNMEHGEKEWRYWKTFEGGISEDLPAFFAGGPVWALAWLPIPVYSNHKAVDQYIAISTHPEMENEFIVGKAFSGPNMIQIWNMGKLNNQLKPEVSTPTLSYAIVHNSSTIWSLEWCPSGCYQNDTLNNYKKGTYRRMGLLAAACSDGSVYIYSLPFPEELKFSKSETNNLPIYKTDPVLILVVNSIIYDNDKQNWQCTELSWTKERGHNTIAAGFSNGYVGVWDITADSPLLKQKQNNSIVMNPFSLFFCTWSYKVWDLENIDSPQETVKKGIITDGAWMINWPSAVIGFDDALSYRHTNTYLVSVREHGYKLCPTLPTNSPTYSVAISDYANGIAHATYAGEILSIFPHQLLYTKDLDKILPRKRQLNSYIKVVDFEKPKESPKENLNEYKGKKSKSYIYMPETYDECKERFGLIIHNNFMKVNDKLAKDINQQILYSDKLTLVPVERYPITSVNKIGWNPNMWSHLWLAAGYHNGLVRFLNFSFMSPEYNMNKLMEEHTKAFLKRINNQSKSDN